MHKCPASSHITDAFGRAPPSEDPGANNCVSHFSYQGLSSSSICFSNCRLAACNSRNEVNGAAKTCHYGISVGLFGPSIGGGEENRRFGARSCVDRSVPCSSRPKSC